ncbi:MAG: outer membrane protein transport protein, partial [Candidatus Hydrogenedentes bacterium]|nr:outer membrane protein transport protein [Candidatus Hydrogenedentota bacterium]
MSRSNHISACALLLSLCCCASWAQEVEISSSPTPIGAGARAAGMADAFVAVADDATAASWNPAGLVQLERPEISMVGEYASLSERFSANDHDEFRVSNSSDNLDLNYLSIAYPLPFLVLGRNVCVSLNYQRKYDFTRAFRLEYDQTQRVGSSIASTFLKMGFKQSGALGCITPAFAFEVTKHLSLGASLNIWRSSFLCDNSWEQTTRSEMESFFRGHPEYSFVDTFEQYSGFEGLNVTTGLLWNMTDKWNLGLRYDSAFTGNAKYGSIQTQRRLMNPLPILTPFMVQEKRQVRFQASFAAGLAYRANDRLT